MRSIAYRTEVFLARYFGDVHEHPAHVVIRTPQNPTYHWGNYVIFRQPPTPGCASTWLATFEREIASKQPTQHVVLAWDGVEDSYRDTEALVAQGLHIEYSAVLTADTLVEPPRSNTTMHVRPLTSDDDWSQALENQILCGAPIFPRDTYAPFKALQMKTFRKATQAGQGAWFGAFKGSQLVGDLGIFVGEGLGRYQNVGTHPEWRGQGVARTMVYQAARAMQARGGVERWVIVVDPESVAERAYQAAGFVRSEWMCAAHHSPWNWQG